MARALSLRVELPDIPHMPVFNTDSLLCDAVVRDRSLTAAPWAKRQSSANLQRLEQALAKATDGLDLAADIGARNPGVSLIGLQSLLAYFRAFEGSPEDLLAAPSESDDAYHRFPNMMERINENVLTVFVPKTLIPLHALMGRRHVDGCHGADSRRCRLDSPTP